MLIQLRRKFQNRVSTVGELYIDQVLKCVAGEDAWHMAKIPEKTRIPAGLYPMGLRTESGRPGSETLHDKYLRRFGPEFHKGMLWIKDVPWFEYVYIHLGNSPDDSKGCIYVGAKIVEPEGPDAPYTVLSSEPTYREIYPIIAAAILTERTWFQVIDPPYQGARA